MKLLVKCARCKGEMQTETDDIKKAKKKCVYCGHTFQVYKNVNNNRVVKWNWS